MPEDSQPETLSTSPEPVATVSKGSQGVLLKKDLSTRAPKSTIEVVTLDNSQSERQGVSKKKPRSKYAERIDRPLGDVILGRFQRGIIGIAVAISIVAGFLLTACFLDDYQIDDNLITATAKVNSVGRFNATVSYVNPVTGDIIKPEHGVFFPTGLREGQLVPVEFNANNPNQTRIAGRRWQLAIIPSLSLIWTSWPILAVAYIGLAWWRKSLKSAKR